MSQKRECWPGTSIAKSSGNAFTAASGASDWAKDPSLNGTAARIGQASAATKRKAGKPLIPALRLNGSTPKEVV
jgi:hypothetical protein